MKIIIVDFIGKMMNAAFHNFFVCVRPFWQLKFMNPSYEFRFQMYYEIDVIIKETKE